jgi:hypothetical protein
MIKGVNIKVMSWISDTTPPTTIVTSHDWNSLAQGETVYYEYVCLKNSGTANLTLAFTDTLNATFGTVKWYIEWYDSGWIWKDWQKSINEAEPPSVPGQNAKPMIAGQTLGLRPASPKSLDVGRIRIELKASTSAPIGELTNFDITVTGTEKV